MMEQLIDDILAFSRWGRHAMVMSEIDMESLFRRVWDDLQAINPARRLTLRMDPLLPAMGDPALIKQVLINLLSNAIKFTKIREVAVIEVGGYTKENENVYYVRDNGVGFDMQYHDRLFGVFQRLHEDEDFEGTGVGLAIVQRVILRHGGRVWAEGKVNEGAIFYFSLPKEISQSVKS
jgi:light-regulated signal transduction histidine kinase (bacteriophytochrome)